MIYDVRTYTCRPGTLRKYVAIYQELGYPVQRQHLGEPVLLATTEVGDVNSYVHIWAYRDLAERDEKRRVMRADPRWQEYLETSDGTGYLIRQENRILKAVELTHA
jgi:hypothetical protein